MRFAVLLILWIGIFPVRAQRVAPDAASAAAARPFEPAKRLIPPSPLPENRTDGVIDTLSPASFGTCLTDPVLWITPGIGPVFGNNSLGDREKAQQLLLPSPGNGFVTHAIVYWGFKRVGADGDVRIKAWSVGPDGAPESFLTASDRIRISEIDTADGVDVLAFPAPAAFTGSVFLSLDLNSLNTGDTISGLGTEEGCGSGCLTWERWSDGSWNPVCDTYDFEDIDLLIEAVVDWSAWPAGLNDPEHGLTIGRPFPQPFLQSAGSRLWLPVKTNSAMTLSVRVLDAMGRERAGQEFECPAPGEQNLVLPVQELPAGNYFLQVISGQARITVPILL